MSVRVLPVLLLSFACNSGLDAHSVDGPDTDTSEDQAFWWWGTTDDDDDAVEEEAEEPREPGDPAWFDAHCSGGHCTVADDFDPMAWASFAHALCVDETGMDSMRMQRVTFETERVDAGDFRASEATWEYRFVEPDPDDLWGYTYIDCIVDVTAGDIVVDDTFTSGAKAPVSDYTDAMVYDLPYALDDIGSWSSITRGGIRWDSYQDEPEFYLADDRWNDWDAWSAVTGERD